MPVPADKFDEVRRKWITRHQHTFLFQKRRAEQLARQIRDRDTERTGARVDPSDDDVIHPWFMRPVKTPYAVFDWAIFMTAGSLAPLGWPLGKALSKIMVQLISGDLRSYPIAALMWSAFVVGLPMPVFYEPGESLVSAAAVPWLLAQVPAALLSAGIYGMLEGWLGVDGARDWWPMRPPDVVDEIDFGFLRADDLTGPGVFPTHRESPPGDASPVMRS